MTIKDDQEDFNNSGLRGIVRRLRKTGSISYVIETEGGWNGRVVATKPKLGTEPFLCIEPGCPVLRYENRNLNEKPRQFTENV